MRCLEWVVREMGLDICRRHIRLWRSLCRTDKDCKLLQTSKHRRRRRDATGRSGQRLPCSVCSHVVTNSESFQRTCTEGNESLSRKAQGLSCCVPLKQLCMPFKSLCHHLSHSGLDEVRKHCQNKHDFFFCSTIKEMSFKSF